VDGRQVDQRFAAFGVMLVVFAQAAIATQPGERALHHPAARQHHEGVLLDQFLDDLKLDAELFLDPLDQLARVVLIGPQLAQSRQASADLTQDTLGPVTVG
jgi:hypothetical protein